jgi:hypothetical protein
MFQDLLYTSTGEQKLLQTLLSSSRHESRSTRILSSRCAEKCFRICFALLPENKNCFRRCCQALVMSRAAQEHDHLAALNIFSAEMVQDLLCTSTGNQK